MPLWTPPLLESAFRDQVGRRGAWELHHMSLGIFLSLFPKTFVTVGPHQEFVRLVQPSRKKVTDDGEEVMVRLALARAKTEPGKTLWGAQLRGAHVKAKFRMSETPRKPARDTIHLPAIRSEADDARQLAYTKLKSNSLPALKLPVIGDLKAETSCEANM
eukprot:TRINITY_DN18730_c0_g1_i2.p2 TRINITY_DN18730_c0_g1~~TRINITY_DN18730_c0_g1_i2.p2  ORF type:complete len:160 (-),score=24.96 TRINITY_DN18730_c0_g1_i2:293-772(-)